MTVDPIFFVEYTITIRRKISPWHNQAGQCIYAIQNETGHSKCFTGPSISEMTMVSCGSWQFSRLTTFLNEFSRFVEQHACGNAYQTSFESLWLESQAQMSPCWSMLGFIFVDFHCCVKVSNECMVLSRPYIPILIGVRRLDSPRSYWSMSTKHLLVFAQKQ